MKATRFPANPIVSRRLFAEAGLPEDGGNINGPSLLRVPDWVPHPLGRYYLYFAHHQGRYIRLAYADHLAGPWKLHAPGTIRLEETGFSAHIASPDVHADHERRQIVMYYHGCGYPHAPADLPQVTCAATSPDGLYFTARPEVLGVSYWRAFCWGGYTYALAMPGRLYRSRDPLSGFVEGPTLFTPAMRHAAVLLTGDALQVFCSNAGDCPERILLATIRLNPDWREWRATPATTLLAPEEEYEGAGLPLEPSRRGAIHQPARQLRDPCIFQEEGRTYLLYSTAGEQGIAIAELSLQGDPS